jgi:hypothetical protein
MKAFDRLRALFAGRAEAADPVVVGSAPNPFPASDHVDTVEESRLWAVLRDDPNDVPAFAELAEIVRRRAAAGHEVHDRARAADDAVWSLAEELAHSGRAWFPLVELARLSVHDDREVALRRLATAAERDPTGDALATGLLMLRDAGLPGDALNLGVGHWRPREHDLEAGRQLVEAAVEAGRVGEARRHLQALGLHPDEGRVRALRVELERLIAAGAPAAPPAVVELDEGPVPPRTSQDWARQDTPGPAYGSGPATGPIRLGPPDTLVDVRDDDAEPQGAGDVATQAPPRRLFRRS